MASGDVILTGYDVIENSELEEDFKSLFNQYGHHFENPYYYQNVRKKIFYNLREKKLPLMSHPPTQNLKNLKKQWYAPFWNPILAKMKFLDKNTYTVKIPDW